MAEEVRVPIVADTAPFERALENLSTLSKSFGEQLSGALKGAAVNGKSLEDVLRRIGLNLAGKALEQGLSPLSRLMEGFVGNLASGILPFARGGVVPFASGGVVSSPTYFPAGRNIGLMGEAGAEAIMPLQRTADGRLGVAAVGSGGGVQVVFNVTAQDAASFRKSEAQITTMLARAVSRGAHRRVRVRRAGALRHGPAFGQHHLIPGRTHSLHSAGGGAVMPVFPEAFAAHLDRAVTTVCHCWRLARRDGKVLGFTDHDEQLTCDGTVFRPDSGFAGAEARRSLGMAVDATEVQGVLSSLDIQESDIRDGLYDGAVVETLLVNWMEPDQFARIDHAVIGQISRRDGRFVAELEGQERALDRTNGRVLSRSCDAELGDRRCGVDLETSVFKGEAIVEAVMEFGMLVSGLAAFENGWFAHGFVSWMTGNRAGKRERVLAHRKEGGFDRLDLGGTGTAGVRKGDVLSVTAGCDRSFATCRAKFANGVNFRGFPHLPGNDAAYAYVSEGQVFDGGPIVR